MIFVDLAILIPTFPIVAFAILLFWGRSIGQHAPWVSTIALLLSTVLALGAFVTVVNAAPLEAESGPGAPGGTTFPFVREWTWLSGGDVQIPFGIRLDELGASMTLMVALVSMLIHLFSAGYMAGEERFHIFFAYISLFAAAMLGLVLAKNLLHVMVFWELMGLMSYLLIGFYYKKPSAQAAQKKAFLTTRIGDLGFLLGLIWIWKELGTLDLVEITARAPELPQAVATGIALAIFLGAVGKSAQFPLHVWLPDAMEGPTPVSALIHAATMVVAGVYLVARSYAIFEVSGVALTLVAAVGAFTAFLAATIATVQSDIKKVWAYSTISQLGYMMLGLGVLGYTAGLFHLLTNAFFKALLFLGSGSLILGAHHEQNIFRMPAMRKYLPLTFVTMLIASASLAGLPPLAGFWSKDEILFEAFRNGYSLLGAIGLLTAVLTGFYVTRAVIITFFWSKEEGEWHEAAGEHTPAPVGGHTRHDEPGTHGADPREGPWTITVPLVVLALATLIVGFVASPLAGYWFQHFVNLGEVPPPAPLAQALPGTLAGVLGIALGYAAYGAKVLPLRAPAWLTSLLVRGYYLDDFYYGVVVRFSMALAPIAGWFDKRVVDGAVEGVAQVAVGASRVAGMVDQRVVDDAGNALGYTVTSTGAILRRLQTGSLGFYALLVALGAAVIGIVLAR